MGDCFNAKCSYRAAQEWSLSTAPQRGPPRTGAVLSHLIAASATDVRDFWPSLLYSRSKVNRKFVFFFQLPKFQVKECICPNKWISTLLGLTCYTKSCQDSGQPTCWQSSTPSWSCSLDLDVSNDTEHEPAPGTACGCFLQQGVRAKLLSSESTLEVARTMPKPLGITPGHNKTVFTRTKCSHLVFPMDWKT